MSHEAERNKRKEQDAKLAEELRGMSEDAIEFAAQEAPHAELVRLPGNRKNSSHFQKGQSGNPSGRPKGLKERKPRKFKPGVPIGRPPHQRQEAIAHMVALFSACGIPHEAIATRFGFSVPTLYKHYRPELLHGREINEMFWVSSLAQAARKGKVDAIKFALERKFGWIEHKSLSVFDGESGIIFDGDRQPAIDVTPE